MKQKICALVDCNNFYVSCERVFNPKLRNKPTLVLSNNDGCVIARSSEVKKLNIRMGAPYFQIKDLIKKYNIHVFSSNYPLYADMSERVMGTLEQFTPNIEMYSIDEAFLELTDMKLDDLTEYGRKIKNTVFKWTGMPVSVGIGRTKTLAKIANHIGKKHENFGGVLSMIDDPDIDTYLDLVDVEDVWGVGRRYAHKLYNLDINTAKDLKHLNRRLAKKLMTVQGERMVLELNDVPCFELDEITAPKKAIATTRMFGRYLTKKSELEETLSMYTTRALEKLRSQNSKARIMQIFIRTNLYNKDPKYTGSITMALPTASNYTPDFIQLALKGLDTIYKKGFKYAKSGVILFEITPKDEVQYDLFDTYDATVAATKTHIMQSVDAINKKWGRDAVTYSTSLVKGKPWKLKSEMLSPRYTTSWSEVLKV